MKDKNKLLASKRLKLALVYSVKALRAEILLDANLYRTDTIVEDFY